MTLFRLGFQETLTGNDLKSDHVNSSNNDENKDFINDINIDNDNNSNNTNNGQSHDSNYLLVTQIF